MSGDSPTRILDERWYSTTLRSIGDAVIATDAAGIVIFMNPLAEALTGWSDQEARGKRLEEVFPIINEFSRKPVENPVGRVLQTGVIVGLANHTVLTARDKREFPIDDSAAPIVDDRGRVLGAVLVFRDASEKRRVAELKERLAAIVENSDDAILSKSLEGIITSWNKGAERLLGYSADEVIGKHISMLMPAERAEDYNLILDRVRRGERISHYETKRRRKDGRVIDISLTVSPLRNATGEIVGASKIARDITDRKLAEEKLREESRRKDEFLAMLAHELRNPLSSISHAVRLARESPDSEDLQWSQGVIERQLKNLARLIDDLLDVSRITRGKIQLRKETLDVAPIVTMAVDVVRPLVEERKHRLNVSYPPEALWVRGDPTRLEQILINLLTNAAKYSGNGGEIWLAVERDGEQIAVRVRDNGIGIPPEMLSKIFELFTQGERSLARSEGGLGIGLTLVKALTELHGGSVTASSEGAGKGSEFEVRLPLVRPDQASAAGEREAPDPAAASRILVVDDNVDTARSLARLLKLLGHDVSVAHTGPEAIETARAQKPQFILLDIGLPGMDGFEVALKLKQESCCSATVFIAVTGYGEEEMRKRARETGFEHHLVKPVDYDLLTELLARRR